MLNITKMKKILASVAVVAVVGGGVATAVATGSGTPATRLPSIATQEQEAQLSVDNALPNATATLVATPEGDGSILQIGVSGGSLHQPASNQAGFAVPNPPQRAETFEAGEAGWRAEMAAAYEASRNPTILGWSLALSEGTMSAEASNYLHGALRTVSEATIGWPEVSKIGAVSEQEALSQLDSNVAVLKATTGSVITNTAVEVVPVGSHPVTFGLEVDLRVHSISELASHISDVFLGLATGLVGTPQATVEGLAINVVDDSGARASVWMNGRDGSGSALGTGEELNPSNAHTADTVFPVVDRGPATQESASATGPETRSGNRGMPNPATSALP